MQREIHSKFMKINQIIKTFKPQNLFVGLIKSGSTVILRAVKEEKKLGIDVWKNRGLLEVSISDLNRRKTEILTNINHTYKPSVKFKRLKIEYIK